jgi:putative hydrolase of the HAD superfamily
MLKPILLDWQSNQTVFLDMDGTLLDLHFDNHFWLEHLPIRVAEHEQIPHDQVKAFLHDRYRKMEGTLNWYCLDHWSEALKMDMVALKREVADRIAIREKAEHFLSHLHAQNQRVVLLTNAHRDGVELKFEITGIENHFDRIISSHDFSIPKEAPGFWEKLQTIEDFDKEKTLFVDDNLHVLRNAQAYGIKHLLAIHQPDSQQPPKNTEEFTAIECFTQLMG